MLLEQSTATVSELRKDTLRILQIINASETPLTIFSNSKPVGVIMSIPAYTQLKMKSEEQEDLSEYAKAWDFLIDPPENLRIKTKGLDAVDLIRKDRIR